MRHINISAKKIIEIFYLAIIIIVTGLMSGVIMYSWQQKEINYLNVEISNRQKQTQMVAEQKKQLPTIMLSDNCLDICTDSMGRVLTVQTIPINDVKFEDPIYESFYEYDEESGEPVKETKLKVSGISYSIKKAVKYNLKTPDNASSYFTVKQDNPLQPNSGYSFPDNKDLVIVTLLAYNQSTSTAYTAQPKVRLAEDEMTIAPVEEKNDKRVQPYSSREFKYVFAVDTDSQVFNLNYGNNYDNSTGKLELNFSNNNFRKIK